MNKMFGFICLAFLPATLIACGGGGGSGGTAGPFPYEDASGIFVQYKEFGDLVWGSRAPEEVPVRFGGTYLITPSEGVQSRLIFQIRSVDKGGNLVPSNRIKVKQVRLQHTLENQGTIDLEIINPIQGAPGSWPMFFGLRPDDIGAPVLGTCVPRSDYPRLYDPINRVVIDDLPPCLKGRGEEMSRNLTLDSNLLGIQPLFNINGNDVLSSVLIVEYEVDGQVTEFVLTFLVDSDGNDIPNIHEPVIPPVEFDVTITSPQAGDFFLSGQEIELSADVVGNHSGNLSFSWLFDGQFLARGNNILAALPIEVSQGSYILKLVVTDEENDVSHEASVVIQIRNSGPWIVEIYEPEDDSTVYTEESVRVRFAAFSGEESHVDLDLFWRALMPDGTFYEGEMSDFGEEAEFSHIFLKEGSGPIFIEVTDSFFSQTGSASVYITVKKKVVVPPGGPLTMTVHQPTANQIFEVGEIVVLAFTVTGESLPGDYRVQWPDGTFSTGEVSSGETVEIEKVFGIPGQGFINFRVTDKIGQQVFSTIPITVVE